MFLLVWKGRLFISIGGRGLRRCEDDCQPRLLFTWC